MCSVLTRGFFVKLTYETHVIVRVSRMIIISTSVCTCARAHVRAYVCLCACVCMCMCKQVSTMVRSFIRARAVRVNAEGDYGMVSENPQNVYFECGKHDEQS